jgi:hypothetical protein
MVGRKTIKDGVHEESVMENAMLTSECFWCGTRYIKTKIGVSHGCDEEKNARNEPAPVQEPTQTIDLMRRY